MPARTCPPDCPAQYRPCGCGWLTSGIGCRHPRWRYAWAALNGNGNGPGQAEPEARPAGAGLLRRAEAAARPLTPERARQLVLTLEVSNA